MAGAAVRKYLREDVYHMLVCKPRTISHRELYLLGRQAQGSVKNIYLHWTAGRYDQVFDDYHLNIGRNGELYQTCSSLKQRKSHTYRRNTDAVGIALCCACNASCGSGNIDFGPEPPTEVQIDKAAMAVAILTEALGLKIGFETVKTHAEAAFIDGYGPGSGDSETRWDLWMLPDLPLTRKLRPGGQVLRGKALWYAALFEERRRTGAERVP